jgi:hypothetical protein
MATKNFNIKLEGKAQLHEPLIKLEDIEVNIWSVDGGVTWENKNVTLDVTGSLEIFMSCKVMSGTDWEFTITDKNTDKKIYDEAGTTGEKLDSRGGERIPNYSERKASIIQ